jgi:hypothetical protein
MISSCENKEWNDFFLSVIRARNFRSITRNVNWSRSELELRVVDLSVNICTLYSQLHFAQPVIEDETQKFPPRKLSPREELIKKTLEALSGLRRISHEFELDFAMT